MSDDLLTGVLQIAMHMRRSIARNFDVIERTVRREVRSFHGEGRFHASLIDIFPRIIEVGELQSTDISSYHLQLPTMTKNRPLFRYF